VRNGKLGPDSGLLAAANIRDHSTSRVTPKAVIELRIKYAIIGELSYLATLQKNGGDVMNTQVEEAKIIVKTKLPRALVGGFVGTVLFTLLGCS
jgi:hypothetical protein